MASAANKKSKLIYTLAAWTISGMIFFPILWTLITSFKTEAEAISATPALFAFDWTLENYQDVLARSPYLELGGYITRLKFIGLINSRTSRVVNGVCANEKN